MFFITYVKTITINAIRVKLCERYRYECSAVVKIWYYGCGVGLRRKTLIASTMLLTDDMFTLHCNARGASETFVRFFGMFIPKRWNTELNFGKNIIDVRYEYYSLPVDSTAYPRTVTDINVFSSAVGVRGLNEECNIAATLFWPSHLLRSDTTCGLIAWCSSVRPTSCEKIRQFGICVCVSIPF